MKLHEQIKEIQEFVDKGGAHLTATIYPPRILDILKEINRKLEALEKIEHDRTLAKVQRESASLHGTKTGRGRRPSPGQKEKEKHSTTKESDRG